MNLASIMKPILPLCFLVLCTALVAPALAQTSATPSSDKEKLSYALGMDVGGTLKKQGFDLDQETFLNAVRDGLTGTAPKMTEDEIHQVLMDFGKQIQAKRAAAAQAAAGKPADPKVKADGQAYLAANKSKPGVVTLPDGLQYKVVKEGTGPTPTAADKVTVKYKGTLIDGTVFDSSDLHGGTLSFPVGGVIHGWSEALQKMKVGSKWTLYIPSDLAYGDQGAGTDIPPGAALVFDVELVAVGGK
jgi:FKBP-type peptidyl-prolyl cis-trans isomerase FklB